MNDKQNNNPAEIDLFYFFKPIFNGLRKLGRAIQYFFTVLWNNKLVFAIIVFIITAAGFSLRYFIPPAYKTEGIFGSRILPAKYCSLLLNNLNKLKSKKNIPILARHLKISPEAAGDIQSIDLLPISDTLENKSSSLFRINLILSSMENLDTIQSGLLNYVENNDYAIKRKEARKKSLESLKFTLINKMQGLDSLKKLVNSSIIPRSEGRGIILGEPLNPVSIYQAEMSYYKELLDIDYSLAIIDNIEIIQPFFKINQPNYPRYNRIAFNFFLVSLVIAALVTYWLARRSKP